MTTNPYALTNTSIKKIRQERGLSQQALADLSGVNIRQIQKIEAGSIDPQNITLKNAVAISEALGITPTDLMK